MFVLPSAMSGDF